MENLAQIGIQIYAPIIDHIGAWVLGIVAFSTIMSVIRMWFGFMFRP